MICVCPTQECLLERKECVLLQVLFQVEQMFPTDTYIKFFSGTYIVSENVSTFASIFVSDTTNFTIQGDPSGSTIIQCDGRLGFSFINITNLTITDIQFISCGVPLDSDRVGETIELTFIPEGTHAALFPANVNSLSMQNVNITLSYGYGMLCVNLFGESHIISTSFTYNYRDRFLSPTGGSILLYFNDTPEISRILVLNNSFYGSKSHDESTHRNTRASGISVVIKQSSYHIALIVNATTFESNSASTMAIYDHNTSAPYHIQVQQSHFNMSFQFDHVNLEQGTAILMYVSVKKYVSMTEPPANKWPVLANEARIIHIADCVFTNVYGFRYSFGYIHISLYLNINVIIEKCSFLPSTNIPAIVINSEHRKAYPDKCVCHWM